MADNEASAVKSSKQTAHFDSTATLRYKEKLLVGKTQFPDPYDIPHKRWDSSVCKWPSVSYPDIYNYLINYPGLYTQESLKAYKSLDGYSYFHCGHVQEVLQYDEDDSSACLLKTKVTPSQRVGDKPHEPWVCLDKEQGYVISAHCTCKAGLGEACSHIAALLFKVMMATLWGLNMESRTSVSCVWNQFYRKKVQAQPLCDISFERPTHGRKQKRQPRKVPIDEINEIDEDEALRELKKICPSACIVTKDDSETDSASEDEEIPPLLTRFHEDNQEILSKEEFAEKCQKFVNDFHVTKKQSDNIEVMTRSQSDSAVWQRQRKGRITATISHDILTLKNTTSTSNIIKSIMQYREKNLSGIEAVKYGKANERQAIDKYVSLMKKDHVDFHFQDCGLFIDHTFPLFGATPDGVRSCVCHGEGLVEVKCSFKHRDKVVETIDDPSFFLDHNHHLKKTHRYYTQVQFQMYVCQKYFCDFVVFTNKGIMSQSISYDPEFVNKLIEKCTEFALNDLVPELIQHKLQFV